MVKKLLITLVIILLALGLFGFYTAIKHRDNLRLQRQEAAKNLKAAQTSITLLEGWSNSQIGDYLEKNNITTSKTFLLEQKGFDVSTYKLLLSKPKAADLEGFIFPDTYFIPASTTPGQDINEIIIKKALDNFSEKITPAMQDQATKNGMDLYKIITLASIIEKEAGNSQDDRNTISGVFYNRLQKGMALQSDATVNYITHKTNPSASAADIEIDSPYNTYKYPGLPPGPICNPSLGSIMAALYPQATGYMYFLTDPTTKRAIFATTYDEQIANKQKYLK